MKYRNLTTGTRFILLSVLSVVLVLMFTFNIVPNFFTGLMAGLIVCFIGAEAVIHFTKSTQ